MPTKAVSPGIPSTPSAVETGASRRVDGPHAATVEHRSLAPAEVVHHPCARRPSLVAGGDHAPDRPAAKSLAERERRDVRLRVVHAPAHVRVDRDERVADEDLAVPRISELDLRELEVGRGRLPARASGEAYLARPRRHGTILRRSGPLRNLPRPLLPCRAALCVDHGVDRACGRRAGRTPVVAAEGSLMRRFRILVLAVVACVGVLGIVPNASASDFADEPCSTQVGDSYVCPAATAGSSYALDIQLKEPWPGCTSMRVSSGSLPPGLDLSLRGEHPRDADHGRRASPSTSPFPGATRRRA